MPTVRDADGAIEAGRFDAAGRRLAHRREPPLDQRFLARPQLGHRGVDVGEDQAFPIGVVLPQCRLLPPAGANVAAEGVEAPQERRGVGEAESHRALRRAHRPVIERQRRVVLPELQVEQRLVPPDMNLVHVARG